MTEAQLEALFAYIDARIDARMLQNSCGPHVSAARQESREAARELRAVFGKDKRHA